MCMDLTRLRYFSVVADELHFGRAAARLHMAQPPLSRQIKTLERELGVTLFERTTRRVTLTEAGRLLVAQVDQLLADADALTRRVDDYRRGDGGLLRLGFVDSSSYDVMPTLLRACRTRWPAIEYELTSMSSDEQITALRNREIDVGLGRTAGTGTGIESTVVLEESLMVAVSDGHDLAKDDGTSLDGLLGETFIGFDRRASPSLHAELRRLLGTRRVDYDPVIEATEYTTVLGLVASGEGIAIVPAGVQSFRPAALRYIPITDHDAVSSLLILRRADEQSALADHVTEIALETFGV